MPGGGVDDVLPRRMRLEAAGDSQCEVADLAESVRTDKLSRAMIAVIAGWQETWSA